MENQYNEIRDYLRKQHSANRNEVSGRYHENGYVFHYDDCDGDEDYIKKSKIRSTSNFVFFFKIVVFLVAVLGFSCYIYGGQDLKKGAEMALNDAKNEIIKLEKDNDTVKETMSQLRNVWHKAKDFAGEHFEDYNNEQ